MLASLHALVKRFLALATEEGKQSGLRVLSMLGLALLAAVLAITGWLWLLASIALALVHNNVVGWGGALGIVALINFACAGGLALMMMRRNATRLFAATRRQLAARRDRENEVEVEVDGGAPRIGPHEREVEEGRMAAYAEYEVIRNGLRRRLGSPLVVGGVLLAGIAAGYLARRRRHSREPLEAARPDTWTRVLGTLPALTSLWIALHAASRRPVTAAPPTTPPTEGEKATAGPRHGP